MADAEQLAVFFAAFYRKLSPTVTDQEEQYYLQRVAQGDLEARNILIERNLRLVAHIMNKS